MKRASFIVPVFIVILAIAIVSVSSSFEAWGFGSYEVENFSSSYVTVNSTGYTVYIEENRSKAPSDAEVLELDYQEEEYNELWDTMFQFENSYRDDTPDQEWRHSLSPRTREVIRRYDYVKYRSFYYNLSYDSPKEIPGGEASFNAVLLDGTVAPGDPAKMTLELKINSENNLTLVSGAPFPFQTLSASSRNNTLCIWSIEYVKSEHVHNWCSKSGSANLLAMHRKYQPGDIIRRNYSIRSQDVDEPGQYLIENDLSYGAPEGKSMIYRIRFSLVQR